MDLPAETKRRVDRLCEAFREEIQRALISCPRGRRREVRAVARVEGQTLSTESHVEPVRAYPLDGS